VASHHLAYLMNLGGARCCSNS